MNGWDAWRLCWHVERFRFYGFGAAISWSRHDAVFARWVKYDVSEVWQLDKHILNEYFAMLQIKVLIVCMMESRIGALMCSFRRYLVETVSETHTAPIANWNSSTWKNHLSAFWVKAIMNVICATVPVERHKQEHKTIKTTDPKSPCRVNTIDCRNGEQKKSKINFFRAVWIELLT